METTYAKACGAASAGSLEAARSLTLTAAAMSNAIDKRSRSKEFAAYSEADAAFVFDGLALDHAIRRGAAVAAGHAGAVPDAGAWWPVHPYFVDAVANLPALEANFLVDRLPAATPAADLRSTYIEANRPFVVEAGGALASWGLNDKWATKDALLAAHGDAKVFVSMLPTPDGSLTAADRHKLDNGKPTTSATKWTVASMTLREYAERYI